MSHAHLSLAGALALALGAGAAAAAPAPQLRAGTIVTVDGVAAGPVAADAQHLVWETGPIETDSVEPLHERNLESGRTTELASDVDPLFGLASTSRFVYYAQTAGQRTSLVVVSHTGGGRRVLTSTLTTPIASRGDVVAWGEQQGSWQMVVAVDARTGKQWTVARLPSCTIAGCFRLDTVTVADRGVVFTRDAVGPHPSFVLRRAFGSKSAQSVAVPGDPQPNLVDASSGALYYVLLRGWFRWDFGSAKPRPVPFAGRPTKNLIRYEHGRWYWQVRHGCRSEIRSSGTGNAALLDPPRRLLRSEFGPMCTQIGATAWTGRQLIASWAISSLAGDAAHEDVGLRGAIVAGKPDSSGRTRR